MRNKIDAKYINRLKREKIIPFINEIIYEGLKNQLFDNADYIKESWLKLENLLKKENLSDETFKHLNNKYRDIIEKKLNSKRS